MTDLTYSKTPSGLEVVIIPSGAAYCTQSSYSRWLGIARQTISDRCKTITTSTFEAVSEKPDTGCLIQASINTGSQSREVVLIPAKIMFRWLAKDNPELFDEIGDAGATQLLYTLAGYQIKAIAPIEHKSRITDLPCPWKKLYEKTFCDRVFGWFGADFYWKYAYCDLTAEEEAKINRLNPPVKGVRGYKIHQYLEPETRSRLAPYLNVLTAMVDTARTRKEFEGGYARHFGGNDQLRIPGVDK